MSLPNHVSIDADSSQDEVLRAAQLLREKRGVVVLNEIVGLRFTGDELVCEVFDPAPAAHRCMHEYEVLVENAQRALETSRLYDLLPSAPRTWVVAAHEHGRDLGQ